MVWNPRTFLFSQWPICSSWPPTSLNKTAFHFPHFNGPADISVCFGHYSFFMYVWIIFCTAVKPRVFYISSRLLKAHFYKTRFACNFPHHKIQIFLSLQNLFNCAQTRKEAISFWNIFLGMGGNHGNIYFFRCALFGFLFS